jgi:hypothetical protein
VSRTSVESFNAEDPPADDMGGKPIRPGGHGCSAATMDRHRMEQVKEIRERVERAEYRVDATAVADAIVRRLLEGRLLPPKAS